jgi:hypothetical protein
MKELTDGQIDAILKEHAWGAGGYGRKLARAAIAADRALNAPADRDAEQSKVRQRSRMDYVPPMVETKGSK